MAKFHAPDPFDFTKPAAWPAWRQRFSRYRIASKLNLEDGDVQVNALLYAMGKDAEPIFSTFTFGDDEDDYYNEVINKFDVHFVPKRNTIHERACFHRRSQLQGQQGESVEAEGDIPGGHVHLDVGLVDEQRLLPSEDRKSVV